MLPLVLSTVLVIALGQVVVEPPLEQPLGFREGTATRTARRIGRSTSGRALVIIDTEEGPVRAEVGPRVIVSSVEPPAGVRVEKALWPELHLWLVSSLDSAEDGLALAARLSATVPTGWAAPDFFFEHRLHDFAIPPNDARYSAQWYLRRLDVEPAWRVSTGSPAVTVAVVDNGCDATHPDLQQAYRPGRDVVENDDDPTPGAGTASANHGTACAGIIAATGNNGIGITGVCPNCTVRCIRMLAERGQMVPVSVDVEAFRSARMFDVAVVSNSWGFVQAQPVPAALAMAIQEVATRNRGGLGALVLFAAGNDSRMLTTTELYSLPEVVTVGAVNAFDELAPFSNRGVAVDVVAPTGTFTTDLAGAAGEDPGDYTSLFGGTSAACPVAAGVAGLLVSAQPDAGRVQLEQWLIGTTRPAPFATPDSRGHDLQYGFGIVSASRALQRATGQEDAGVPDAGSVTVSAMTEPIGAAAPTGCGCQVTNVPWLAALAAMLAGRRTR